MRLWCITNGVPRLHLAAWPLGVNVASDATGANRCGAESMKRETTENGRRWIGQAMAWLGSAWRAWRGVARPGEARHGTAGRARRGAAGHGRARHGRRGEARRGRARLGLARQAGRGAAGQGSAWHGRLGEARQGAARRGVAWPGEARHGRHGTKLEQETEYTAELDG